MVKFSKELEAQLIPEWKDAFVNYWLLKKQVKKIKLSRVPKQPPDAAGDFGVSIFDPVRFVTKKISDKLFNFDNKTEIIQVVAGRVLLTLDFKASFRKLLTSLQI